MPATPHDIRETGPRHPIRPPQGRTGEARRGFWRAIAEAVRVLEEGIALRPVDIDAVELFGYGFPRHRGGPMHQADRIGPAELIHRIETYAEEDPQFWQVPDLLRQMEREGRSFADLNG